LVELTDALIRRSEKIEPHINAFTETYFDDAIIQARESEKRYVAGNPRDLEGLPVAIKDEFRLKGRRRTSGSRAYRDRIDNESDIIIQRLLNRGAIAHAKTTTPEFCLLGACHSPLWGITRNPWNPAITPGGSSGGSGASLAAGTTTIATGTDIGGSIRIPAALCGIVGYKPPYGRNPEIPVFNLDFYSHSGPMARTAADCALMQNVISGFYRKDIATLREKIEIDCFNPPESLRGKKIAFNLDLGFMEIDRDVEKNFFAALERLSSLGAKPEPVDIDWSSEIIDAAHHYWAHNWAATMLPLLENHREELAEYTVWFLDRAGDVSINDYHESIKTTVRMYDRFGPMLEKYDAFICPTLATSHIPAEFSWPASKYTINGQRVQRREEHWSLTYPFNMLSRCPVLSMPSGLSANGVPTAIQIIGRTFDDRTVFEIGMAYESVFPFTPPQANY